MQAAGADATNVRSGMKPNVYIDSRTANFIRLDVGSNATVAYITLPISEEDHRPLLEWCQQALTAFTDEAFCNSLTDQGLIEFAFANPSARTLYTIRDLTAEILQAISLPGGISEGPR